MMKENQILVPHEADVSRTERAACECHKAPATLSARRREVANAILVMGGKLDDMSSAVLSN